MEQSDRYRLRQRWIQKNSATAQDIHFSLKFKFRDPFFWTLTFLETPHNMSKNVEIFYTNSKQHVEMFDHDKHWCPKSSN